MPHTKIHLKLNLKAGTLPSVFVYQLELIASVHAGDSQELSSIDHHLARLQPMGPYL
jgi:hypothetical protein